MRQNLFGYFLIAVAIVIAGIIIANSIRSGFSNLGGSLAYLAELLRSGLIESSQSF